MSPDELLPLTRTNLSGSPRSNTGGLGRWLARLLSVLFIGIRVCAFEFGDTLAEFKHQVWTAEDGLPGGAIHSIVQTRDGYLWIATQFGLARFDGLTFTVFNHVNTPQMTNDNCYQMVEDRDGSLWVLAHGHYLLRRRGSVWTAYHPPTELQPKGDGLAWGTLGILNASRESGLWLLSADWVVRFQSERFIRRDDWNDAGIVHVVALDEDPSGLVWVHANGFLKCVDPAAAKVLEEYPPSPDHGGLAHSIHVNSAGDLWVFNTEVPSRDVGALGQLWRFKDGRFSKCSEVPLSADGRSLFMLVTDSNDLWFPAGKAGLDHYRDGQWTRYALDWGMKEDFASSMCEDREGNLWIGAESGALHRLQPKTIRTFSTADGLLHESARTILEARDGTIWVGTDGGVSQLRNDAEIASSNSTAPFLHYSKTNGLTRNDIRALAEDQNGVVWIGTGNGLNSVAGNRLSQHRFPGKNRVEDPDGVGWNKIRTVLPASDGSLWIALQHGLHRLRDGVDTFYTRAGNPPAEDIRVLLENHENDFWMGTAGKGLLLLRIRDLDSAGDSGRLDGLEVLEVEPPPNLHCRSLDSLPLVAFTETHGLASNFIWSLHQDAEGALWIGTERGLNRLIWENNSDSNASGFTPASAVRSNQQETARNSENPPTAIFKYGAPHGLIEGSIHCILEDDLGNLWFSTEHGIYRVGKQELNDVADRRTGSVNALLFDEADGMLSAKTSGQSSHPAGCKTRDGRLWFPTEKGVVILDPATITQNTMPPPVVIEQVVADHEVVFDNGPPLRTGSNVGPPRQPEPNTGTEGRSAKPLAADAAETLELPPGRGRVIEFHYTANSFIAPARIRFQFRLEGYESEWNDAGTRRTAFYTNLSPGDYRFRVRAANHHNVWNEAGAGFAFAIAPFYYQTLWFRLGLGAVLLAAGYTIYHKRVAGVRRAKDTEQRLALAMERQRIARDIHDDIGARLTQIALLGEIAEAHRNPTAPAPDADANIAALARGLAGSLDAAIWAIQPENDHPEAVAGYFGDYAQQILSKAGIDLNLDFPEKLSVWTLSPAIRHNLFLAIKEALNNVIKHSHATRVRMTFKRSSTTLELTIEDNGHGFDIQAPVPRGRGDGLENMRRRVEACGGRFEITSQPGKGTAIRFLVDQSAA